MKTRVSCSRSKLFLIVAVVVGMFSAPAIHAQASEQFRQRRQSTRQSAPPAMSVDVAVDFLRKMGVEGAAGPIRHSMAVGRYYAWNRVGARVVNSGGSSRELVAFKHEDILTDLVYFQFSYMETSRGEFELDPRSPLLLSLDNGRYSEQSDYSALEAEIASSPRPSIVRTNYLDNEKRETQAILPRLAGAGYNNEEYVVRTLFVNTETTHTRDFKFATDGEHMYVVSTDSADVSEREKMRVWGRLTPLSKDDYEKALGELDKRRKADTYLARNASGDFPDTIHLLPDPSTWPNFDNISCRDIYFGHFDRVKARYEETAAWQLLGMLAAYEEYFDDFPADFVKVHSGMRYTTTKKQGGWTIQEHSYDREWSAMVPPDFSSMAKKVADFVTSNQSNKLKLHAQAALTLTTENYAKLFRYFPKDHPVVIQTLENVRRFLSQKNPISADELQLKTGPQLRNDRPGLSEQVAKPAPNQRGASPKQAEAPDNFSVTKNGLVLSKGAPAIAIESVTVEALSVVVGKPQRTYTQRWHNLFEEHSIYDSRGFTLRSKPEYYGPTYTIYIPFARNTSTRSDTQPDKNFAGSLTLDFGSINVETSFEKCVTMIERFLNENHSGSKIYRSNERSVDKIYVAGASGERPWVIEFSITREGKDVGVTTYHPSKKCHINIDFWDGGVNAATIEISAEKTQSK